MGDVVDRLSAAGLSDISEPIKGSDQRVDWCGRSISLGFSGLGRGEKGKSVAVADVVLSGDGGLSDKYRLDCEAEVFCSVQNKVDLKKIIKGLPRQARVSCLLNNIMNVGGFSPEVFPFFYFFFGVADPIAFQSIVDEPGKYEVVLRNPISVSINKWVVKKQIGTIPARFWVQFPEEGVMEFQPGTMSFDWFGSVLEVKELKKPETQSDKPSNIVVKGNKNFGKPGTASEWVSYFKGYGVSCC